MKLCLSSDWIENKYLIIREEGDSYFDPEEAIEVDDEWYKMYLQACEDYEVARSKVLQFESIFQQTLQKMHAEGQRKLAGQEEHARNLRRAERNKARKARYHAKKATNQS